MLSDKKLAEVQVTSQENLESQPQQETDKENKEKELSNPSNNNVSPIILDPDKALRYEKNKIYKQFEGVVNQKLNLRVVGYNERNETPEETKARVYEEEEAERIKQEIEKKNNPKAKKPDDKKGKKGEEKTPVIKKVREVKISKIKSDEKYNDFTKWIITNLQIIIDMDIKDVYTNESIFQKIYPQANGAPEYNQSGRYWVKLYFMGKLRKVEIDDYMPCNRFNKLLLPRCENMEELWPLLITKALLKLFSFKFQHQRYYSDCKEDCSILYALTGYVGEKISFNYISVDIFNIFKALLSDENYLAKRKIMLCYKDMEQEPRKKISSKDDFDHLSHSMKVKKSKLLKQIGIVRGNSSKYYL